jgi:hypothetical protein
MDLDRPTGTWPPQVFAHLSIHHPKPERVADTLDSMRRVAEAAQGAPGLIAIGPWQDARSGRIIGLALWESKEAFEAAMPAIFQSLPDPDPDGDWQERPTEGFRLTPA